MREVSAFRPSPQQRQGHKRWPRAALMYHNQKPNGASPPASTPSPAGSDPGGQASLGDCQQGDGKPLNPRASEDLCSRPTP